MSKFQWNWSAICEDGIQPFKSNESSSTDLAPCFQQICLDAPMYACLAVVSSYYFGLTFRIVERNIVQRRALVLRLLATFGLSLIPLVKFYFMIHNGYHVWPADVLVLSSEFIAWVIHFGEIYLIH